MKKAILIFIVTLLFTGCLEEEWDDCNSILWLTFYHEGLGADNKFDDVIENDVYVYVYKNDKYHHTVVVPYAEIQNGEPYPLRKTFTGQLSIAAWAVPKNGGTPSTIPDSGGMKTFSTATIAHKDASGGSSTTGLPLCSPTESLYLGVLDTYEYVLTDSQHYVEMVDTRCQVLVYIPIEFLQPYLSGGAFSIHVGGSSREATLDLKSYGEEVLVHGSLQKDDATGYYQTGALGIMPSYNNKPITVTAYAGDTPIFTLNTDILSKAGDIVTIYIQGQTAEITVKSEWDVKTSVVYL